MIWCGIDEAGRGPVLSNLVICAVTVKEENLIKLGELGVKDSKELSASQRRNLFHKIINLTNNHAFKILSPQQIDSAVNSETTNLNWLEADNIVSLLNELKPDKAIVDCPSRNKEAFKKYIDERLTITCDVMCHHKADKNYLEVAAASVLAKVTRDRLLEETKREINIDFGSGYPGDPKTKQFLSQYGNKYPDLFRKSWAPYKKLFLTT